MAIAHNGLVAALKQMSYFFVFPVEISRVPQLEPLHDLAQWSLAGFDQQVNVVAHQHVSINVRAVSLPVLFQSLQIVFPVCVATEYHLALIAPANHMVKCSRIFYSRLSRHCSLSTTIRFNKLI